MVITDKEEEVDLRHVVLRLEDGGDEWAQEGRLHEPDEGPEREAGEVRRLQRGRLVPDGGDVHLLHRRHGERGGALRLPPPRGTRSAHVQSPNPPLPGFSSNDGGRTVRRAE